MLEQGGDGQVNLGLGEALARAPPHPKAVGDDLRPLDKVPVLPQQPLRPELPAVAAPDPGLVMHLADVGDDHGVGRDGKPVQLHLLVSPVLDPERHVTCEPVHLVNEGEAVGSLGLIRDAGELVLADLSVKLRLNCF